MALPSVVTSGINATSALVSKGIYAILLPMHEVGIVDGEDAPVLDEFGVQKTVIKANRENNLLQGYAVGSITSSGDTVSSEEFQNQLAGGNNKTFVGGAIDPGDFTITTYFNPDKGRPPVEGVVDSIVYSPQFILMLAVEDPDSPILTTINSGQQNEYQEIVAYDLKGFWCGGVNYNGGNDFKGDIGKIIGSSLKFKATGDISVGFEEVGNIGYELYDPGFNRPTVD
jgi:hypothetical protein